MGSELFHYTIMGYGFLAVAFRYNGHHYSVGLVSSYRLVNLTACGHVPDDHCLVFTDNIMTGDGFYQLVYGSDGLGNNH